MRAIFSLWQVPTADQINSIEPDQTIGHGSSSLGRNSRGGLPCSASLRLPTRKFWTCPKNSSRDREATRSRSNREVIGYWLSGGRVLHINVLLPVLLYAVKTVKGDFRFCWMISPNVGKTHNENPNLVRMFYMKFTWNNIYKQYNKL